MSFELWLFRLLAASLEGLNAARQENGASLRLTDRATLSRYQVQEAYELLLEKPSKAEASALAEEATAALGKLPEHNYIHTISIDGAAAQRQGEPTRWVYSVIFTVTRRRDVTDWQEVD